MFYFHWEEIRVKEDDEIYRTTHAIFYVINCYFVSLPHIHTHSTRIFHFNSERSRRNVLSNSNHRLGIDYKFLNSMFLSSDFKVSIERFPCIISQSLLESVTFLLLSHTGGRPRVTVTHSRRQRTPKGNAEWMKRWMNSFLWMNLLPPLRQGDRPTDLFAFSPLLLLFPLLFLYFLLLFFFISVAPLLIAPAELQLICRRN